jgi:RNA-directed DNA polymerase
MAKQMYESPVETERMMEEICEQENCRNALRRVKANKGSPGVDAMSVEDLPGYLRQHWPEIRAQLLSGTYRPRPVRRVEIPKLDGGMRKLGVPTVLDRWIQQAILQVLQRRWDANFSDHSYGFRPKRSAHQAVSRAQQYIIEGRGWVVDLDLEKFFDRVNHDRLMARIAQRISDKRLLKLIRAFLTAGVMEDGLVSTVEEGTPQGGPLSPLLSNIMLNEFDQWMEASYLSKKVRKDRWRWNFDVLKRRPIAVREGRQWKPAVAYCRYADDFTVQVKGTKAHALEVREACRSFLEGKLQLTLNMDKTHIPHVNDGFVFLGHRIIRKRGPRGSMRPVTTIPWARYRGLARKLVNELSGNYSVNKIDMVERLNRTLAGWANFYQFTDYTSTLFQRLDRLVFWKLGHWLARKYRATLKTLCRRWVRAPEAGRATTWVLGGPNSRGIPCGITLRRLVTSRKGQFRWRLPDGNPYILRDEKRNTFESRYAELVFAMSNT